MVCRRTNNSRFHFSRARLRPSKMSCVLQRRLSPINTRMFLRSSSMATFRPTTQDLSVLTTLCPPLGTATSLPLCNRQEHHLRPLLNTTIGPPPTVELVAFVAPPRVETTKKSTISRSKSKGWKKHRRWLSRDKLRKWLWEAVVPCSSRRILSQTTKSKCSPSRTSNSRLSSNRSKTISRMLWTSWLDCSNNRQPPQMLLVDTRAPKETTVATNHKSRCSKSETFSIT